MVEVKEKKSVKVLKAPFRGIGFVIEGTGRAVRGAGKGLCWLGEKVSMYSDKDRWVSEREVVHGGKPRAQVTIVTKKENVKIFNEKGEK